MSMANKYSSGTGPDENIQTGIVFKIVSVLKFPFRVANSICDFVILNSSRVIRENETIDKILFRSYRLGPFDTLNREMLRVLPRDILSIGMYLPYFTAMAMTARSVFAMFELSVYSNVFHFLFEVF